MKNHSIINRSKLPDQFPTNSHPPQFWEKLGRVIATYGFLEEVLGKAIFAFTATTQYNEDVYKTWLPTLKKGLSDSLSSLSESYLDTAKKNSEAPIQYIEDLVADIKEYAQIRNVLCHGSWPRPNSEGKSIPLFVNYKMEVWDIAIGIEYLEKLEKKVANLIYSVIDSVTSIGYQFPGGAGPGQQI